MYVPGVSAAGMDCHHKCLSRRILASPQPEAPGYWVKASKISLSRWEVGAVGKFHRVPYSRAALPLSEHPGRESKEHLTVSYTDAPVCFALMDA